MSMFFFFQHTEVLGRDRGESRPRSREWKTESRTRPEIFHGQDNAADHISQLCQGPDIQESKSSGNESNWWLVSGSAQDLRSSEGRPGQRSRCRIRGRGQRIQSIDSHAGK